MVAQAVAAASPRAPNGGVPGQLHTERGAAHLSPRGSRDHSGAHPNAWDPVRRASLERQPFAPAGSIGALGLDRAAPVRARVMPTASSEPHGSLAARSLPAMRSTYLEELEDACSPRPPPPPPPSRPLSPAGAALAAAAAVAVALGPAGPEAGTGPGTPSTPGKSPAEPFAALEWAGLELGLDIGGEQLRSVDASLGSCRLSRRWGGAACAGAPSGEGAASTAHGAPASGPDGHDAPGRPHRVGAGLAKPGRAEVLALQPAAGVESAALTGAAGEPLALRMRWQPGPLRDSGGPAGAAEGPPVGAGGEPPLAHVVSAHVGLLRAAYAPGFATQAAAFAGWAGQGAAGAAAPEDCPASAPGEALARGPLEAGPPGDAPAWLRGRASLALSLLGVRLAALADGGAHAEALVVAAERVSAHLGAPRAPARPRSLAAALWALPRLHAARLRLTVRAATSPAASAWE